MGPPGGVAVVIASREPVRLSISATVRRTIQHARKLSKTYEWPVAREALGRILADLEARGDDPSLNRLRIVIQKGDQKYLQEEKAARSTKA